MSERNNTVFAVLYKYNDPRISPFYQLYAISASDGTVRFIFPLPVEACEFSFAQDTTKLICSSGYVFDISSFEPKLIHDFNWV